MLLLKALFWDVFGWKKLVKQPNENNIFDLKKQNWALFYCSKGYCEICQIMASFFVTVHLLKRTDFYGIIYLRMENSPMLSEIDRICGAVF